MLLAQDLAVWRAMASRKARRRSPRGHLFKLVRQYFCRGSLRADNSMFKGPVFARLQIEEGGDRLDPAPSGNLVELVFGPAFDPGRRGIELRNGRRDIARRSANHGGCAHNGPRN